MVGQELIVFVADRRNLGAIRRSTATFHPVVRDDLVTRTVHIRKAVPRHLPASHCATTVMEVVCALPHQELLPLLAEVVFGELRADLHPTAILAEVGVFVVTAFTCFIGDHSDPPMMHRTPSNSAEEEALLDTFARQTPDTKGSSLE
eukprot:CAMPEP_0115346830 /NCGR_PEP_ID=MMETSP0270-20121206/94558_1 /TAXON_ID=71861 /ORGANISM="Scrippsiella trochoidea, Strain CCMP3099" /LENGTH=146 /DNA_ID=CAMNT_0002768715 /DNA_START=270 /DNA_END=708 /DNA_ORIENTATION=+